MMPTPYTWTMLVPVYSSEGMSDELAHIMVLHLDRWHTVPRHLDADEHVWSAWVTWDELIQGRGHLIQLDDRHPA